jgi:LysM repeat protein
MGESMIAGYSDRWTVRTRRGGRHTIPWQVKKVAQQARKAAPVVAIVGALVAPQASHALVASAKPTTAMVQSHTTAAGHAASTGAHTATVALDSFETRSITVASATPMRQAAATQGTYYSVRTGDTLAKIAVRFYHNANDWQYLYHENAKTISNPNLIYVGERLFIPATAPSNSTLTSYVSTSQHSVSHSSGAAEVVKSASPGMYNCSGLEQLWEQAGGSSAHAFMAAEIAMAESGGNPNAISPTDDFGLWQINASHGSLATLNPLQNAKSAIILSDDGTNWGPWTTYHSGAYVGRC